MTHWAVYTRPGCTLCETLMGELAELLGPEASASVEVVDITLNSSLESRYGSKIPVVTANGEFVCCFRLDRARVLAHLQS